MEALFTWMESWALTTAIVSSEQLFALTLGAHVFAMAMVVGTVAAVDLRLLGASARHHGAAPFAAGILPWTWAAFGLASLTGLLLFAPQAARYAQNGTFQLKFALLALAGLNMLVFNLLTARRASGWEEGAPPVAVRIAGGASLLLWFSVLAAGRMIAYDS